MRTDLKSPPKLEKELLNTFCFQSTPTYFVNWAVAGFVPLLGKNNDYNDSYKQFAFQIELIDKGDSWELKCTILNWVKECGHRSLWYAKKTINGEPYFGNLMNTSPYSPDYSGGICVTESLGINDPTQPSGGSSFFWPF